MSARRAATCYSSSFLNDHQMLEVGQRFGSSAVELLYHVVWHASVGAKATILEALENDIIRDVNDALFYVSVKNNLKENARMQFEPL
ncbi:hypothetical protein NPIL_560811 [Nephila pilipes]|uniref:Uncharacterized protein n=1 Tax=Nephila pilipes TaxID=299642 RepID=A0A8X6PYH3_NEPPI|nr:hypothetical protein NPIL_560811 [Nephila pilipes]